MRVLSRFFSMTALVLGLVACGTESAGNEPVCGDNLIEGNELCDGTNLGGGDCLNLGFTGGTLSCAADCRAFDATGCTTITCGDGVAEGGEACDGGDLGGTTCSDLGFPGGGGALACNADCSGFDTIGCLDLTCGDGVAGAGELCDGADLGGVGCVDLGFTGGTLACSATCDAFDTGGCTAITCGDGFAEGGEVCDGTDLQGADCPSVAPAFTGGTLACATDCQGYDTTACTPQCGNGVAEPGETCDGSDFAGADCQAVGPFVSGTLSCAPTCDSLDTTACVGELTQHIYCVDPPCQVGADFITPDVDCDGLPDLVISDFGANGQAGEVYIFFNTGFAFASVPDVTISGAAGGSEQAGFTLAALGNFSGHTGADAGCEDLAIGAPFYDNGAVCDLNPGPPCRPGAAVIFRGRQRSAWQPAYDTSGGPNGPDAVVTLDRPGLVGGEFYGLLVRNIGDFNNDGRADLGISGTHAPPSSVTHVLLGRDLPYNAGSPVRIAAPAEIDVEILGVSDLACNENEFFGNAMGPAGDLDGDGFGDFLIGAPGTATSICGNPKVPGKAYLVFGSNAPSPQTIDLASPAGRAVAIREDTGGTIVGTYQLGFGVGGLGDFNDDGFGDIAISDNFYSNLDASPIVGAVGAVWVFYGGPGRFAADLEVDDADLWIRSDGGDFDTLGFALASSVPVPGLPLGDVTADGIPDLLVSGGAYGPANPSGVVFQIYGRNTLPTGGGWTELGAIADQIRPTPYPCGRWNWGLRYLHDVFGVGRAAVGIGDYDWNSYAPCNNPLWTGVVNILY